MSGLQASTSETLHQRKPSNLARGPEEEGMLRNGPRSPAKLEVDQAEQAELGNGKLVFQEKQQDGDGFSNKAKDHSTAEEGQAESLSNMNPKDKRAVILLVILCRSFLRCDT